MNRREWVLKSVFKKESNSWEKSDFYGITDLQDIQSILQRVVSQYVKYKKIIGDPATGKHTIRLHPEGIKLDIYICERDNWGWILMLRTGPASYNKWLVSREGLKKHGYTSVGGKIVRLSDKVVIPTYEEEDVFKLMGMDFMSPEDRA